MSNKPLNEDIHYLNGQIDALTALVMAVANCTVDKHEFRTSGLLRLQAVETALLHQSVPESRLIAIEHMKQWLENVTN
ncbi:hypothetical protein [Comamonas aquatilis]|uniref:hypothetical protein n=1 Tax=Comamonas aquatilis TaxID=1778406 RepID=UPI0039F02E3F